MSTVELGAVTITRLMEWNGPILTVDAFFPDLDRTAWDDNRAWLAPDFWRPADDAHPVALQSWLLRSDGRNILVDTGGGSGKSRPANPVFDHLDTDLLAALDAVGLRPEDIDVVVNTHLHVDHVGWNTVSLGRGVGPDLPERHLPAAGAGPRLLRLRGCRRAASGAHRRQREADPAGRAGGARHRRLPHRCEPGDRGRPGSHARLQRRPAFEAPPSI